jgi:hypothetical protein
MGWKSIDGLRVIAVRTGVSIPLPGVWGGRGGLWNAYGVRAPEPKNEAGFFVVNKSTSLSISIPVKV